MRIFPPFYFLGAVLLMVVLHRMFPIAEAIPPPYSYAGAVLLAFGLALVLWINGLFRKAETTIKPFEESSSLVTHGPFAHSRNPIYLGMAVGLLGVAVLLGSVSPFLVVPVFVALIQIRFIHAEEAILQRTFGESYTDYRCRVRRWL